MKLKFFALFLALSMIVWAQAPQAPTTPNSTPAQNSTPAPEAKGCCHHSADMKEGCCHHAKADSKDAMSCCGDKCQAKDGKSCCEGKDMKACAKECKKAGCCKDAKEAKCCTEGKGCCKGASDQTAEKCCGGNKCERHQQVAGS